MKIASVMLYTEASMNRREWISNSSEVNEFSSQHDEAGVNVTKVLGHVWDVQNNTLNVKQSTKNNSYDRISKRSILKQVSEVFDPLGFLSSILLKGQIIIHESWKKNLDWDDEIQREGADNSRAIQIELR